MLLDGKRIFVVEDDPVRRRHPAGPGRHPPAHEPVKQHSGSSGCQQVFQGVAPHEPQALEEAGERGVLPLREELGPGGSAGRRPR